MKGNFIFLISVIFILLVGMTMGDCASAKAPSENYVRQHKGEGMRRTMDGSEAELMDMVAKEFGSTGLYTIVREPHAILAIAVSVDLSYAFYFYPSQTNGQTDVEVLIASKFATSEDLRKYQEQAFATTLVDLNREVLKKEYDPNVKVEGVPLSLTTAAYKGEMKLVLKLLSKGADPELAIYELKEIASKNLPYLDKPANRTAYDKANLAVEMLMKENMAHLVVEMLMEESMAHFKKDDFETTREYEARVRKIEVPFSAPIALGRYDADRNGFEIELRGNKFFIPIAKEKAREMSGRKRNMRVEGKLKYYGPENVALAEANLVDGASNERFALYRVTEGASTASLPRPAPKPAPKAAPQAAYAPVPTLTGYAPAPAVSEIDAIPNFKTGPRLNDIAVVIGIEKYQSVPKSDFSTRDAVLVKGYLKAMGFQERNIALLTDEQATFSGIRKTVESWLPNRVKAGSKVFVYYSGHGAPEPNTGEAYIVPFDGDPNYLPDTAYPIKRLYEKLGGLKAAEVVVALDSCFSGAGGRSVLAKGARPLVLMAEPGALSSNMAVLTATNGPQISTSSPEKGHGVFTYYFLKALKDGKGTVADIYEYMKPQVEDEARLLNVQQTPGVKPSAGSIKGRFSLK